MAFNPAENEQVNESSESVLAKVGDNFAHGLFKELMEAGKELLDGGLTKPPSEQMLMAGLNPAEGLKVVQQVLDQGVVETPNLYKGSMI